MLWNPTDNCFKLMVSNGPGTKGLASHFYDASGKSFRVPEELSADEHEAAKRDAYARAVDAWNALGKGKKASHRRRDANARLPNPHDDLRGNVRSSGYALTCACSNRQAREGRGVGVLWV